MKKLFSLLLVLITALGATSALAYAEQDTIKIGYMIEQSTSVGYNNEWAHIGVMQWLDEFNEAGGVNGKKIELITYD
ncbi:MAG: ABC transporter substrate-binding protein, partial [Clostridia bacterium]|nr:ABC transporter substrate-binding protein [Clostridia bacterium]